MPRGRVSPPGEQGLLGLPSGLGPALLALVTGGRRVRRTWVSGVCGLEEAASSLPSPLPPGGLRLWSLSSGSLLPTLLSLHLPDTPAPPPQHHHQPHGSSPPSEPPPAPPEELWPHVLPPLRVTTAILGATPRPRCTAGGRQRGAAEAFSERPWRGGTWTEAPGQ